MKPPAVHPPRERCVVWPAWVLSWAALGLLMLVGLVGLVGLVVRLVTAADTHLILGSVGQLSLYGSLAYGLGIELPRAVRGWDVVVEERASLAAREQSVNNEAESAESAGTKED